jgi:hypothetical protein
LNPVPILVPDAGPLITLAYAGQLDLLQQPGWPVHVVDMVLHEVTRNPTPTSAAISVFFKEQALTVVTTEVWRRYQQRLAAAVAGSSVPPRKTGLGELAIQEYMTRLGLDEPAVPAIFLFEDHKIARASFHLPDSVRRVSTRAYLHFLEERGWIASAEEIEHHALQNGRDFSRIRFP